MILFHWVGALVYIVVEVIPDAGLLRGSFQVFPRRRRIQELERTILDNPSAGNYEELGLLYLDDGNFARPANVTTKRFLRGRTMWIPFYRRGIAEVELGDFAAAVPDLERAVSSDPDYDFHRAKGLLAWAYAQTGQTEKADAMFRRSDPHLDHLRDVLPLRAVSAVAGTRGRSARVVAEDSRQEADHAADTCGGGNGHGSAKPAPCCRGCRRSQPKIKIPPSTALRA